MNRVSAQGFDELMRNVHYDYNYDYKTRLGPAPQVRSVDDVLVDDVQCAGRGLFV